MLKACICCLWCLTKCLTYLNQNAYTATDINITSFCKSTRDLRHVFVILVENVFRVATINTMGDFVLFLGKVLIVSCTAFAVVLALNYQRDYTVWVLPLLIFCLFFWLVAHCFLSVFEIVVDVLFLCFAVDTKHNDGSPGREFYMDKALMVRGREAGNTSGPDPILSSTMHLAHYNLGIVAKVSFIITLVEIPGLILTYIHNQLKRKVCILLDSLS
ncbi:choline transporter-like protein 1 [Salvelinus namaycush]|uniref:Choline transporter-like protein n=1 Tax=Salvelinus namaycush TaxID=8040 RepID=A0A8U0Q5Z7_SALNM|nr:choline transporter-like protein 1 [Salvelinus namaycush]